MKTLLKLMALAAVMTASAPGMDAVESVEPPAGSTEEAWQLSYDNYRYIVYSRHEYHDITRDVTVVRDGSDIYFKGVFKEYPEAWIKGEVSGNVVRIGNIQPLGDDVYFKSGSLESYFASGHTIQYFAVQFSAARTAVFTMSGDGDTIMAVPTKPDYRTVYYAGFWYDTNTKNSVTYYDGKMGEGPDGAEYEHFPDTDFMTNMCFRKIHATDDPGTPGEDNPEAAGEWACAAAVPPAGTPEESWTLVYDNYMYLAKGAPGYEYHNLTRDVTVARDGADIYFKGVFENYPDAWIKGTAEGSSLTLQDAQPLEASDGTTAYFRWGAADYRSAQGEYFNYNNVGLNPNSTSSEPSRFTISEDGGTIAAVPGKSGAPGAFWYTSAPDAELSYYDGSVSDRPLPGIPERDFMVNLCFKKSTVSGIGGVMAGDYDGDPSPMYDLQGREVDPESASPGIYIRGGKKLIIR